MFVLRRLNCTQTRLAQSTSPTAAFDSGASDWVGFLLMREGSSGSHLRGGSDAGGVGTTF